MKNSSELIEEEFSDQVQILRETLRLMRFNISEEIRRRPRVSYGRCLDRGGGGSDSGIREG